MDLREEKCGGKLVTQGLWGAELGGVGCGFQAGHQAALWAEGGIAGLCI